MNNFGFYSQSKPIAKYPYFFLSLILYIYVLIQFNHETPSYQDDAFRIVSSSIYAFFFSGFLILQSINIETSHWLETISLSFIFTQIANTIFFFILFIFNFNINDFIIIIFFINFLLLIILLIKISSQSYNFKTYKKFSKDNIVLDLLILIGLIYLATLGYRVSNENCAECHLHLSMVRKYFHNNFDLSAMGYIKNSAMPNLLQGWEFLIALIAKLSYLDPIYVYLRMRFIIPVLGLSSIFLLMIAFFINLKKSLILLSMIYLLAFMGIFYTYLNIDVLGLVETSRGILHFMGTSHHLDSAVDIMLPAVAGFSIYVYKAQKKYLYFCLSIMFISAFTWHPRIYFINQMYVVAFILLFLVTANFSLLKRVFYIFLCYVPSYIIFSVANLVNASKLSEENLYPSEINFKLISLHNMLNYGSFYTFRLPGDFGQITYVGLLACCFILFSLYLKDIKTKVLTLFIILFSILVYFSNFLYYFTELITYSEFMMGNIYFLYIPFYILICSVFYEIYYLNSKLLYSIYFGIILINLIFYNYIIENIKILFLLYLTVLIILILNCIKKSVFMFKN